MSSRNFEVTYCFRWNARRGRPGEPMTPAEALGRYESGEEFTAALFSDLTHEQPILVTCAWKNDYASVTFLDGIGRTEAKYIFEKEDDDRLFLEMVNLWEYSTNDPSMTTIDAVKFEVIKFRKNGFVEHVKVNKAENTKDTIEYTDVPVHSNWEPMPEFGDWESISRYERS